MFSLMIANVFSNNKWFCNFFGWHQRPKELDTSGFCLKGICPRCENAVMQDSNGGWF